MDLYQYFENFYQQSKNRNIRLGRLPEVNGYGLYKGGYGLNFVTYCRILATRGIVIANITAFSNLYFDFWPLIKIFKILVKIHFTLNPTAYSDAPHKTTPSGTLRYFGGGCHKRLKHYSLANKTKSLTIYKIPLFRNNYYITCLVTRF
jgi:hypothetical protein